jgi:hypothetical protein
MGNIQVPRSPIVNLRDLLGNHSSTSPRSIFNAIKPDERTEAVTEQRLEFGLYGEGCLLMCLHVNSLSDAEFFSRYGTTKAIVLQKIKDLEQALTDRDFVRRNQIYDFFIEAL